jgi:hypothetical protein
LFGGVPSPGAGAMTSGGTLVGSVGDGTGGGVVAGSVGGGGLSVVGGTGEVVVSAAGAAFSVGLLQAIKARVVPAATAMVRKGLIGLPLR